MLNLKLKAKLLKVSLTKYSKLIPSSEETIQSIGFVDRSTRANFGLMYDNDFKDNGTFFTVR